jgi:hypothetical protein
MGVLAIGQAGVIVESTFDSGDEGWLVGNLFDSSGSSIPIYQATGGNPGGFIRTDDQYSWNGFHAPASFLGDQSAAYAGTLTLDQRLLTSDGIAYPMVVISDGTTKLQYRTVPPGTDWTSFSIPLMASAGWEISDSSGNPGATASELQLQEVLSSLTFLNIEADWQTGADQIDLDNVRLSSPNNTVPDGGSTLALLGGAVFLVGLFSRKGRK